MKKTIICLGLLALVSTGNAFADFPEAYPGSFWGTATRDRSGVEGWGTQGNVNQGVQLFTLPGSIPFKLYGAYSWRLRTENNTYYSANGPALGGEFAWKFFNFGAAYERLTYPLLDTVTRDFSFYLTWYARVDFFSSGGQSSLLGLSVLGFPTTTWGRLSYDLNDIEGAGTMGWISQGIDWFRLPGDIVFRTLAIYRWRFRTLNEQYYDAHGPGVGIELGRKSVDLGASYSWQMYPHLNQTASDLYFYLTWYLSWDFKSENKSGPTMPL
jgi:hypothetical protein